MNNTSDNNQTANSSSAQTNDVYNSANQNSSSKAIPRWVIYLIIVLLTAGAFLISVKKSNGKLAFNWRPSELMAAPTEQIDGAHDLQALSILNRVQLELQENYVDPERFDPVSMIAHALDDVQKYVPEVLFIFDRGIDEKPTSVDVIIGNEKQSYSLKDITTLWEMSLKLRAIFKFVDPLMSEDVNRKEVEYVAINGMLSTLDPHSLILSPEVYKEMSEGNRGKFGGLGIMVRMIDGVLIVMDPMPGEPPAVKAGLKKGDQILAIDGTPTLNMNIQEAVDMLKGDPATTVELTVMRKGWTESRLIKVVRDEITIPSIESDDLGDHIAYVKIKGFQSNSQADLLNALKTMRTKMGSIEGLILDLRGNPGGLLDQAVMIANNFLTEGVITKTEGPSVKYQTPYNATPSNTEPNYPIAVLIDSSSASASEIVAGALKNLNRAIVLGDTSFGKGSVQIIYELQDGSALKLTIAQYLTPGDLSIQSVGIVPDIKLIPMIAKTQNFDLYSQQWVRREASLGSHLDNQKARKDLISAYNLRYLSNKVELPDDDSDEEAVLTLEDVEKLISNEPKEELPKDNPQVKMAKEILLATDKTFERNAMLKKLSNKMQTMQEDEEKLLAQRLSSLNIDWTKGNNPNNPKVSLELSTTKPDNTYKAGEKYTITATVTNNGVEPLYRVVGLSESTYKRINDKEFLFGRIDPGQSVTRTLDVSTNIAQRSRLNSFGLQLYFDENKSELENPFAQANIQITTLENPQPHFEINYAILDESGNGLLDDKEKITLRVWVANTGEGVAEKPLIFLKNKNNKLIKLREARVETEPLKPGEMNFHDFVFDTQEMPAQPVSIELHVYDKKSTQMLVEKIGLVTSKADSVKNATFKKHNEKMTVANDQVKLFSSPSKDSNSLSTLPESLTLQVNAAFGDYLHIVTGDIQGWVLKTDLKPAGSAPVSQPPVQTTLTTIPRIILPKDMPLKTAEDTFHITADVESYSNTRDFYIYTVTETDHRTQAKKVAYQKLPPQNAKIDATVPLEKGLNRIKLFVRDTNNSEAYEVVSIYHE